MELASAHVQRGGALPIGELSGHGGRDQARAGTSFRLIVKVSRGDDIFTERLPHDIFT